MKAKINIDQTIINKKMDSLREKADVFVKRKLVDIAEYATLSQVSPVDTGAYVTSFSYAIGAGRPRGKSSLNRPKANKTQARQEGFNNLLEDINKIKDLSSVGNINLRNGSPHADFVEYGNHKSVGHAVFSKIKSKFR